MNRQMTKTEKKLFFGLGEKPCRDLPMRYDIAVRRLRDRGLIKAELRVHANGSKGPRNYWHIKLRDENEALS